MQTICVCNVDDAWECGTSEQKEKMKKRKRQEKKRNETKYPECPEVHERHQREKGRRGRWGRRVGHTIDTVKICRGPKRSEVEESSGMEKKSELRN